MHTFPFLIYTTPLIDIFSMLAPFRLVITASIGNCVVVLKEGSNTRVTIKKGVSVINVRVLGVHDVH